MATRLGLCRPLFCSLIQIKHTAVQNPEFQRRQKRVRSHANRALYLKPEGRSISASGRSGTRSCRTRTAASGAGAAPEPLLQWWRHCLWHREPETACGRGRGHGGPGPRRRRLATALVMRLASRSWSWRRGCSGQRGGGAAEQSAAGWYQHQPNCLTEEREHAEDPELRLGWRRPQKLQRLNENR
jgi:hypothetical protein